MGVGKQRPVVQLLSQIFGIVNGGYSFSGGVLWVSTLQVSSVKLRTSIVKAATTILTKLMFAKKYPNPSMSKWAKGRPCGDKLLVNMIRGSLASVAEIALGR